MSMEAVLFLNQGDGDFASQVLFLFFVAMITICFVFYLH